MILWKMLKIFCLLQDSIAGKNNPYLSDLIQPMSASVSRLKPRGGGQERLSQIEDVCPRQDVTCADDTNKVVKVIFSVHSAKVH